MLITAERFDGMSLAEEKLRKVSICRTCKAMDKYICGKYRDIENWDVWVYPDEMCDCGGGHRTVLGDTGNGVIIDECPNYEKSEMPVYEDYLRSEHWKKKRREIIEKAGFKCSLCGSAVNLNVHHITYERLCFEDDEDLVCVCKDCHAKLHEKQ